VTLVVTGKIYLFFCCECVLVDYRLIIARKLGPLSTDLSDQILLNKVAQSCN